MKFIKPAAGATHQAPPAVVAASGDCPMRWSDIAAGRKSTHPGAAPIQPLLNTTELLEQVLMELPPKDVFILQRVCRRMRDVIEKSSPVQLKLFLRAAANRDDSAWIVHDGETFEILTGAAARQNMVKTQPPNASFYAVKPVVINQDILTMGWAGDFVGLTRRLDSFHKDRETSYNTFRVKDKKTALEASNRSMYLSQPPATTVVLTFEGHKEYMPWEDRRGLPKSFIGPVGRTTVTNPDGITLDEVRKSQNSRGWLKSIIFTEEFVVSAEIRETMESGSGGVWRVS